MSTPPSDYCICDRLVDRPGILCADCASHPALLAAFEGGQARLADPERKPERPA